MLNSFNVYHDNGRKAGRAMRNGDIGLYRFLLDWQRRAESLESAADKQTARKAYDQGYAEGRGETP